MNLPDDASPRTALITGGTLGIGYATALALARQGFQVVITARDEARARAATTHIAQESGNPDVSYLMADLFRPAQVRELAGAFLAGHSRLDVLVNNAGGSFTERVVGEGGFERTWALNHLAYVQLSLALLPLLVSSAPARIVNVTSSFYASRIDLSDLQGERHWNGNGAYLQSKLANILFTYALARRLAGTDVSVNAVNPGIVRTGMGRDMKGLTRFIRDVVYRPFQVPPDQGAVGAVFLASAPELEGVSGQFYDRTGFKATRPVTQDQALQERLWRLSLEQLDLSEPDWAALKRGVELISPA